MALASTALAALASVLPEAVLGTGVVALCGRLWRSQAQRWIPACMLALGTVFTAAATSVKALLSMYLMRRDGYDVDWASYDRSILLWQAFFCLISFAVIASVSFGITATERLREAEARRSQAELLRARSELKALRAQLNPHFLFNTLHSVEALVREHPAAAEEALEQLGDLLRYALRVQDAADEGVLLREEWEFVRVYLSLEKLRPGERLRVEEEVSDEALECVVPAFVLQPLVENAIRHGIGPQERGGTLRIRARCEGEALQLQVEDDGCGAQTQATKGTGKGLALVRQRLRALYGAAGSVEIAAASGSGFSVTLRLPRGQELS